MGYTHHEAAWHDPRLKRVVAALLAQLLIARLIGGGVWRLEKRRLIVGATSGVIYGYLTERQDLRTGHKL